MINTHTHKKLFNSARPASEPPREEPPWTDRGTEGLASVGLVRLPVSPTRCGPSAALAWHPRSRWVPAHPSSPWFLLLRRCGVCGILTRPETPWGRGGVVTEGKKPGVGSHFDDSLLTACLLPYRSPSLAQLCQDGGGGGGEGALGLQRSQAGQKKSSLFPSLCLCLSLSSCFQVLCWALC